MVSPKLIPMSDDPIRDRNATRTEAESLRGSRNFPALPLRFALLGVLLVLPVCVSLAQGTSDGHERSASYSARTSDCVFADSVVPHWFGEDDSSFWYRLNTAPSAHRFVLVDAKAGTRNDAFDHVRLAESLSMAVEEDVKPDRLQLQSLRFSDDLATCSFRFAGKSWSFQLPAGPLSESEGELADASAAGLRPESRIARSRGGSERTPIRFENRLDRELEYFWVMDDGGLRSYGRVGAGKSTEVQTFGGHAWLLKDESGQPVASFVASLSESLAVIDKTTIAPRLDRESGGRRRDPGRATSPDGKWRVEIQPDGLTIADTETESSTKLAPLVIEGVAAETLQYQGRIWWSPDSAHFVVMQVEPGENRTINLIE